MLEALIVCLCLITTDTKRLPKPETYTAAYKVATETGKPLLVMVSTEWCAPCQIMKKKILPRIREWFMFPRVAYCRVNPDDDSELAEQITGGGPIPQLVLFRKTKDGWLRQKLIGGQSVESVEEFIEDGIKEDEKTHRER